MKQEYKGCNKAEIMKKFIVILSILILSTGCLSGNVVNDKYYLNSYGNLTPAKSGTFYVGNPTYKWAGGYFNDLTANYLNLYNDNTQISRDGAGNMIFKDAVAGTNTLLSLVGGGGGGNITGGGSSPKLTYWSGATSIADSNIYFDTISGKYGVGNATPSQTWSVYGTTYLAGDVYTDRWLSSNQNTLLGVNVAGNDDLAAGGVGNTAVGYRAIYDITSGFDNTAIGKDALTNVLGGYYNTAIGADALNDVTSGNTNTAVGQLAGGSITTGQFNTAIGTQSLLTNNGDYNTALGQWAGANNTGSSNLFLGFSAGQDSLATSNKLYIDNSNTATPLIYGDFANNSITINEDLTVADDANIIGTLNLSADATIKTDSVSARDLVIVTGAQKTIILDTPVFEDLRVPVTSTTKSGSKDPHFSVFKTNGLGSQGVFSYWFDASAEEELYFTVQIPHSYKLNTTIVPHVHWTPSIIADGTPANQVVRWGLEYTWADKGQTFGNTIIIYTTTHYPADANVVAGKHYYSAFSTLTPTATAGQDVSSMLICRVFRDATSLSDNYEQDAGMFEIDFHYGIDTIGSRQDLVK
jgi:hypothetical protein